VDSNVGDPDNDATASEVPQVLPFSTNPEPGNEDIDMDRCCMCFTSWQGDVIEGGGAEWIFCLCGRWLHEDCVEDVVQDQDGNQRFCSFCIDKYMVLTLTSIL